MSWTCNMRCYTNIKWTEFHKHKALAHWAYIRAWLWFTIIGRGRAWGSRYSLNLAWTWQPLRNWNFHFQSSQCWEKWQREYPVIYSIGCVQYSYRRCSAGAYWIGNNTYNYMYSKLRSQAIRCCNLIWNSCSGDGATGKRKRTMEQNIW